MAKERSSYRQQGKVDATSDALGISKRLRMLIDELGSVAHFAERLMMLGYSATSSTVYGWLGGAAIETKAVSCTSKAQSNMSVDWLLALSDKAEEDEPTQ